MPTLNSKPEAFQWVVMGVVLMMAVLTCMLSPHHIGKPLDAQAVVHHLPLVLFGPFVALCPVSSHEFQLLQALQGQGQVHPLS